MFAGFALQGFAKVGVRKRNHGVGPFGNRLALQIHNSKLRDDVHHVGARRCHDIARGQLQHYAALSQAVSFVG